MPIQTYYPIENIKLYLFVIAVLEALALYTWQFRKLPGAMVASISQVCKGIWLLALVLCSTSTDLENKIFWITVLKMAGLLLACFGVVFTWQISQQKKNIDSVTKYSLGSFLCLGLLLISNWHDLVWRSAWLDGQAVVLAWGPGHLLVIGYTFLLGIISTILAVRWIVTSAGLRRQQAWYYSLAVLISWVSFVMWRFGGQENTAILPGGFLLNGAVVSWIYYRMQMYNILPLAQAVAVENVVEGIFFVDKEDYVVDINASAKTMLSGLPVSIGADFKAIAAAWPALAEVDSKAGVYMIETQRQQPKNHGFYQLTKIPLQTFGKHPLGRIILVKDITSQKQDQAQLIEQQKAFAILAERNRLGREIHDGSGQIWNYLQLELKSLSLLMATEQTSDAAKLVERLKGILRDATNDVRESIVGLKSGKPENHDFITTLQEYFRWYEQTYGIAVVLTLPDKPLANFISNNIEVQLLRIIQEALTNIRKHADASQAHISMQAEGGKFVVVIGDNGCSFEPAAGCSIGHYGLNIMRERAEEVGGQFIVESGLDQGTKVKIVFNERG